MHECWYNPDFVLYVWPSSFKRKQTQNPTEEIPHTKQEQNPENSSVNLILWSFFVQVLMQITFCTKCNNVLLPLELRISLQVLWKFKYFGILFHRALTVP